MSQSISFDQIPADWRVPGGFVEIRPNRRNVGVQSYPTRTLLIGGRSRDAFGNPLGTALGNTPYRMTRGDEATALFGPGSTLEAMSAVFFRANTTSDLYAISVPDPVAASVAATGEFSVDTSGGTGAATVAGEIAYYIGGIRVPLTVTVGQTRAQIVTALVAAINAVTALPVTAGSPNIGRVVLTAKVAGAAGNAITLAVNTGAGEAFPGNLNSVVTPMSGGTDGLATATLTLAGSPTISGTLGLDIAGKRATAPVTAGQSVSTLATALAAAVNADPTMPVRATASAGVVTFTAKFAGTIGNALAMAVSPRIDDVLPAGLAVAATPFAGGAGTRDIAAALAAIAALWFTDVALAFTDSSNLAALEAELTTRYAAQGKRDGHGYYGRVGTFSALSTAGAARNSPFLSPIGMDGTTTPPWVLAASACGVAAFALANDPARQLRGLVLPGVAAPAITRRFTPTERDLLLRDGISTIDVLDDGAVVIERMITEYQKTNLGVNDTAWLDIIVPRTLSRIRYDWLTYVDLTFPRVKLVQDGSLAAETAAGIITPRIAKNAWAGRCRLYEQLGWIQDSARTVKASFFDISASDRNRLEGSLQVSIVGNLITLANQLEFES